MRKDGELLNILRNVALKISAAETPMEVLDVVMSSLEEFLLSDTGAVVFFDESISHLNIFKTKGMDEKQRRWALMNIPKHTPSFIEIIKKNNYQPFIWKDVSRRERIFFDVGDMRTFFWIPVIVRRKPIGFISLAKKKPNSFDEDYLEVCSILANLIGGELQRLHRSYQTIQDQEQKITALIDELSSFNNSKDLVFGVRGDNHEMNAIYNLIMSISDSEPNVIIEGESGTGKELIADYIHYLSPRKNGPLVKVNCGALSESLLESELFGHVKGAFTGAHKARLGRFEIANSGTLLLDEVDDMSKGMQVKLLRVLQSGTFERVGDSNTIHVNVRVVCATNKNLKDSVKAGHFREDLYYRLNVISIQLPPLRERLVDLSLFIEYFIGKFNTKYSTSVTAVSKKVLDLFYSYPWPGNIRELENTIERGVLKYKSGIIEEMDFLVNKNNDFRVIREIKEGVMFPKMKKEIIENFEREYLIRIMEKNSGHIVKSCNESGLNRKNFYLKMKKYSIKSNSFKK